MNKKTLRLRDNKNLNEGILYDIDAIVQESEDVIKRFSQILVKELRQLIKDSTFFSTDPKIESSMKDSRKVFMILKSFKQLTNSEQYVYRTINNEIIEPEFNKLVQKSLKCKSLITLSSKFDKKKLPSTIFIEGVIRIFKEGSLKNLIKMCHGKPLGKYKPLSKEVYI